MAWLARGDFTGSDYVQASDLNNLHNDDVTWGGNVNGGGYTLSNVILEGVVTQSGASGVSSFNTRIGAVVSQSGDYTAAMVGAVPTSLQILTPPGSGLSGGGPLTGNLSLSAAMVSFNARIGAITLTPADISGAMGVLQSRAITAGAGLQGGGNLAQDVPLSVIPGDPTQQIQFIQGGLAVATRHAINFISGANVNVAVADPGSASGRVDVTISSTGGGSGMVDPTTTKGDVIVRGPSITGRLPVGADGQVLTADSTQSLGVKWGAASGSGAVASVFGRTGAVVAATGDYSAAQVTNAVDRSQTYSDPMWLTGLNWSKIIAAPTFLLDPTTTKGDLVVHGASAISRLPVGGDGAILVADSTQALGVRWGASLPSSIPAGQFAGDMLIWQQAGGWGLISAAGQPAAVGNVLTVQSIGASTKLAWQAPPPSQATLYWVNGTQVQSSFGVNFVAGNNTTIAGAMDGSGTKVNITITAGGPTSGLADPTTTKGDLIARATAQVTRLPVGTDGTILMADSTQALGVKWATVSGGGGGGAQTPWTSNIDAAGFTLNNIPVIQAPASNNNLILNAPGAGGSISLQADGTTMATINETAGLIAWGSIIANVNVVNGGPPSVTLAGFGEAQWSLTGTSSPTTPGTDLLTFQCFEQTAGIYVMNDLGYFGIGVAAPAHAVDAAGDCNVTGLYRIGGAQLAAAQVVNAVSTLGSYADPAWITSLAWSKITGAPSAAFYQTPWVSNINAANFTLMNVSALGVGTGSSTANIYSLVTSNGSFAVFNGQNAVSTGSTYLNLATNGSTNSFLIGIGNSASTTYPPAAAYLQNAGGPIIFYAAAETMRITSAGNVGIGAASPDYPLTFAATLGSKVNLFQGSNYGFGLQVNVLQIFSGGISTRVGIGYGSSASFTETLSVVGGNVGIGTTAPVALLTLKCPNAIVNSIEATRTLLLQVSDAFAADIGPQIGFGGASGGSTTPYTYATIAGRKEGTGAYIGYLQFSTIGDTTGVIYERMRITGAGNVGIGTAAPSQKLHVYNAGLTYIQVQSSSQGYDAAISFSDSTNSCNCGLMAASGGGAGNWAVYNGGIRMAVTPSGNVGIGTATPATEAANCRLALVGIAGQYASSLPTSNTQAVASFRANANSGYTLAIGGENTNGFPYLQGVNYNGGAAACHIILQPWGDFVGIGTVSPICSLDVMIPSNSGQVHAVRWGAPGTPYGMLTEDPSGYYSGALSLCQNGTPSTFISANGPSYLMGGSVGIGTASPRSTLSVISGNPSGFSANLLTLGEASNNTAYQLGVTFTQANGHWVGSIQALEGGVGGAIFLNPLGGAVRVNGGAAPSYSMDVTGDCNVTGAFRVNGVALTSGMAALGFHNSGGNLGSGTIIDIYGGGGTTVSGGMNGTIGAYSITSASDARLKQNVTTLVGGLSVVTQLRPIRAEWNGLLGKRLGEPILSVIAQEAQAVAPDAVYSFRARLNRHDENETELLAVEPLALIAHLILAVQQLEKRLKALEPAVN